MIRRPPRSTQGRTLFPYTTLFRSYLHLYSEVGQGTTAKVYLPAVRDRGMSELEAATEAALPGGTETILLVEDDPTMRAAAQQLLSKVDPVADIRAQLPRGRAHHRKRSCWWRTIPRCARRRSSCSRRSATGSSLPSTASRDSTPTAPTVRRCTS